MSSGDFLGPIGNASEKYADGNPITRALLRRFLTEIDATVQQLAPSTVLDVGCGEGVVTERMAVLLPDAEVVGLDAEDERLAAEWGRRRRENLTFRVGSGYELPYGPKEFDLVCAMEVLEHVERPEVLLGEMARVARRALLVSVPREPLWRISHLLAGRNVRSLGNTPGHINHWSSSDFAALVSRFGRPNRIRRPFPWTMAVVDVQE
jgi:2-polyprenyl-3-methyl-5-hydroxy-6-metoxy-1,4-benzoquinol methylase